MSPWSIVMQAFLSRLRSQKAEQSSIPFSQTPSSTSSQTPATQTTATPSSQFDGIRKIHPNQDELLSSSPDVSRGSFTELGMRVPSALARVANRKVTPTGIDETIRESSELQRPEESSKLPSESGSPRKQNSSLFSAIPFSGATGWSTFGRNQKENQIPQAPQEERSANARSGGATVSRTSSQSRTTTATRTPPTKSSGLSRSNSAKLSRNNSTKLPTSPSSTTEQASYSRVPLVPTHDIHENVSPRIEEGETSPSHSQQQDETTPSSPSARPLSVFTSATPHEHTIDGTYPPRTTVTKNPEPIASSSLPFTFGRQPPARPLAENVFISELGVPTTDLSEAEANQTEIRRSSAILASKAAVPGGNQWPSMVAEEILRLSFLPHGSGPSTQTDEPFPLLGTPSSELVPSGTNAHPRTHLASDTSTDPYGSTSDDNITGVPHRIPSLISDYSNAEQSQGAGRGWTPDLPLRGMASFGSSGDELTTPRIASSWTNPSEISSRFDAGTRVRQTSDERRRIRSGSSSSTGIRLFHRQTSSDKSMGILKAKNPNLPAIGPVEPITVFPVATTSSQEFPKQDNSEPAITTAGSHNPDASTSTSETATNPPVAPVVAVTAPTPPRPSRSRSRSNRLTELFTRESLRIPEGHAHASGIGVVGVEPHSRRQSLKVMGKRKAGESEEENEIVVNDERGHRPRFDSSGSSFVTTVHLLFTDSLLFSSLVLPSQENEALFQCV